MNNPVIQHVMQKFFDDRFNNAQNNTATDKRNAGKMPIDKPEHLRNGPSQRAQLKSPSDTTIYAPVLKRKVTPTMEPINAICPISNIRMDQINHVGQDRITTNTKSNLNSETMNGAQVVSDLLEPMLEGLNQMQMTENNGNVDIIDHFVDNVRAEQHPEDEQVMMRRPNGLDPAELELARDRAQKTKLQAEKYKTTVEPPGKQDFSHILDIGSGVSDDDFFHLTCHIEPSLIHKIEKGEFVELEKLLPKDRLGKNSSENRLEWVQRDGGTFLVPAQKDNKIGGFRRWEQAFRAYATIYCGANPHRAKEIWQYITVINTAASSYSWDNVYNYDITFRHLMAFNPQRSWAITYNQMWNLSMKDPLPCKARFGGSSAFSHASGSGYVNGRNQNNNAGNHGTKKIKPDYCWDFNKGLPCKFGNRCRFIERCSYCDSPTHGVNSCHKLSKKSNGHRHSNEHNNHHKNQGNGQGQAAK